jgi:hypothetical protein
MRETITQYTPPASGCSSMAAVSDGFGTVVS